MKTHPKTFRHFLQMLFGIIFVSSNTHSQTTASQDAGIYYSAITHPANPITFREAVAFYTAEYQSHLAQKDTLKAANDLEVLAFANYKIGSFDASENYYVRALDLLDGKSSSDVKKSTKRIYNMLGLLYKDLKAYDRSLDYYGRSLGLAASVQDSISLLNNMANAFRDSGEGEKAVATLEKVLSLAKKFNDSTLFGFAHDNLGFARMHLNDSLGYQNLKSGLQIRQELGDPAGLFSSYRHLALFHKRNNQREKARQYALQAFENSSLIKDKSYELEALNLLASLDGNVLTKRYQFLSDSITTARQNAENRYAALKYDVEKERQRTQLAELQGERDKQEKIKYQAVFVIVLLLSGGMIFGIIIRQRRLRLQAIYKQEGEISKNIHDNVANGIYRVMAQLQQQNAVSDGIIDDLDEVYALTRAISKEHAVVLDTDFGSQLQDLLASFKTDGTNVITRNLATIQWEKISPLKKTTLFKVLQELMINAKKHSKASFITIVFRQQAKKLEVTYRDNGVGCSLKKQNGLHNVEFRIRAVRGTVIFESEPNHGFRAEVLL